MAATTDEERLTSWWDQTRSVLNDRGVVVAHGEVSGRSLPVVGLKVEDALSATTVLLDVLKPRLCLWEAEHNDGSSAVGYRVGLLGDNGWHVLECGVAVDSDDRDDWEDSGDEDEDEGRHQAAQDRVMAIVMSTAESLAAQIEVGMGCDTDLLENLLLTRVRENIDDEADVPVLSSLRWDVSRLVRHSLQQTVRDSHVDQICTHAEAYARRVQTENANLHSMSRAARRDAVYRALKRIDKCITRDSSRTVSDALERLLDNQGPRLFE